MSRTAWLVPLLCAAALAHADDPAQLRDQAAALVAQGKYADAEPLLTRALASQEKEFGPDAAGLIENIDLLGALYRAEGRNAEAQTVYARSLSIRQKTYGADSSALIPDLKSLASLYAVLGQNAE